MAFRVKGFSLVELVVVMAIMGVLFSLGLPAVSAYSRNIKLRAAAESFMAGLQLARGEAIRLNTNVELILTNDAPVADSGPAGSDYPALEAEALNNLGTLVAAGKQAANSPQARASIAASPTYNWMVRTLPVGGGACGANSAASQAAACWLLAGRRGAEGSGSGTDSASPILIVGPASITFTSLGGASAAADFNFSSPAGGACVPIPPATTPVGTMRCLRVRVELGGRVKMCDPAATATGDTRSC